MTDTERRGVTPPQPEEDRPQVFKDLEFDFLAGTEIGSPRLLVFSDYNRILYNISVRDRYYQDTPMKYRYEQGLAIAEERMHDRKVTIPGYQDAFDMFADKYSPTLNKLLGINNLHPDNVYDLEIADKMIKVTDELAAIKKRVVKSASNLQTE